MAARWTVIFQLRAVEVAVRCVRARAVPPPTRRVAGARRRRAGRARPARARARHAHGRVRRPSRKAAERLALHGASASSMLPLLSVQKIPDGNHPVRLALRLFQSAGAFTGKRAAPWKRAPSTADGRRPARRPDFPWHGRLTRR
ncbi:unnamed protein product [Urochloa humidicola]